MNASHGSANELSQENIKLLRLGPEKEMLAVNGCGAEVVV